MISVLLRSGVTFMIIFTVLLNKDRFLKRIKQAAQDTQNDETSQKGLLSKNGQPLALKMLAVLTPSLTKEETFPHKQI